jgi:hypothetical protein
MLIFAYKSTAQNIEKQVWKNCFRNHGLCGDMFTSFFPTEFHNFASKSEIDHTFLRRTQKSIDSRLINKNSFFRFLKNSKIFTNYETNGNGNSEEVNVFQDAIRSYVELTNNESENNSTDILSNEIGALIETLYTDLITSEMTLKLFVIPHNIPTGTAKNDRHTIVESKSEENEKVSNNNNIEQKVFTEDDIILQKLKHGKRFQESDSQPSTNKAEEKTVNEKSNDLKILGNTGSSQITTCSRNSQLFWNSETQKFECVCHMDKNCAINIESVSENDKIHPLLIICIVILIIIIACSMYLSTFPYN